MVEEQPELYGEVAEAAALAKSQVDFVVISRNYLTELQRSGQTTTFRPTVNIGRGPIKIYFDFGANLPAKNDAPLPVYLTVEDKGTGL